MLITGIVCLYGLFMSFVIFLCACIDVYSHFCLHDMKEYLLKRIIITGQDRVHCPSSFYISIYLVTKSSLGLIYFTRGDIVREKEWRIDKI